MATPDFRAFAKSKGYTLKALENVAKEVWLSLQNDFLILTVPEIEWLVRHKYVRHNQQKEWCCTLCEVPSEEMLTFFKEHFSVTHAEQFAAFYRQTGKEVPHSH